MALGNLRPKRGLFCWTCRSKTTKGKPQAASLVKEVKISVSHRMSSRLQAPVQWVEPPATASRRNPTIKRRSEAQTGCPSMFSGEAECKPWICAAHRPCFISSSDSVEGVGGGLSCILFGGSPIKVPLICNATEWFSTISWLVFCSFFFCFFSGLVFEHVLGNIVFQTQGIPFSNGKYAYVHALWVNTESSIKIRHAPPVKTITALL